MEEKEGEGLQLTGIESVHKNLSLIPTQFCCQTHHMADIHHQVQHSDDLRGLFCSPLSPTPLTTTPVPWAWYPRGKLPTIPVQAVMKAAQGEVSAQR